MKARIATAIFSTVLAIAPMLIAQTPPDATLPAGDAARGKAIFESSKGNCRSCHRVNGTGSLYGPDLSAIGAPPRAAGPTGGRGGQAPAAPPTGPTPQQLAQSILDPNAVISV
jgi:mono/diheme cytochrome c family protein